MNLRKVVLPLFGVLFSAFSALAADPWQSVDRFQAGPGLPAAAAGAAATSRALFVVGEANVNAYDTRWLVRRSRDDGKTWKTVDLFDYDDQCDTRAVAIAVDPVSEAIFVAGQAIFRNDQRRRWIVRKSTDDGRTWRTIDNSLDWAGVSATPTAVAVDGRGRVYVTGTQDGWQWITRRSSKGGRRWTIVDRLAPSGGAFPQAIVTSSKGEVFVGGVSYRSPASPGVWTVRRSPDGRNDWTVADSFALDGQAGSEAKGAAVTESVGGSIAFVGRVIDATGRSHWLVRIARQGSPFSWQTVDEVMMASGTQGGAALAAAFSDSEELFVSGGKVGAGQSHDPAVLTTWATRRGTVGTVAWRESDELAGAVPCEAAGLFFDHRARSLYAVGKLSGSSDGTAWEVRKLAPL